MKKTIIAASVLLAAVLSCTKEADYYNASRTEPSASFDEGSLEMDGKAENATIRINTNLWWKAHVRYNAGDSGNWVTLDPDHGYGNVEIHVTLSRNYGNADRQAIVVVEGDDKNTSFSREFTLVQKASSSYVEIAELDGNELNVPIIHSVNTLSVKANNDWTAQSDQPWCTLTGSGERGDGSLQVDCAVNTSGAKRSATIKIVSKTDPSVSATVRVVQDDVFAATQLTVDKQPGVFRASWTPVVGAASYQILVQKVDGTEEVIEAGAETAIDLAAAPLFATPEYAGYVVLKVKTLSEDPSVFSVSEGVESNSHFTSGKGTSDAPFVIGDKESLQNISAANSVLSGAYYKLDFDPSMDEFEPLCSKDDAFAGIFDGNGKTLSAWKPTVMADENAVFGLFRAVASGAVVRNLNLQGCALSLTKGDGKVSSSANGIGFVAGLNDGEIADITLTDCTVSTEAGTSPLYVGGIAGQNTGTVTGCTTIGGRISAAEDRNKSDEFNVGGITGYNTATGTIRNCVNGMEIIAMNIVGGIAGYNDGKVLSCGNKGRITANYYFGGVVGYVKTTGKGTFQIKDCYNTGTLVMDEPAGFGRGAAYVGGIVSRIHSTGKAVDSCFNSGEIIIGTSVSSSSMRVGGIVGHINNTGTLSNCYFSGKATIAGKANFGGIVGEFASKATVVSNCYSVGTVTLTDSSSGNLNDAFGSVSSSAVIKSCYALSGGGHAFAGGSTSKMGAECGYKSEAELKTQSTFDGWDFSGIWEIGGSYPYPHLRSVAHQ